MDTRKKRVIVPISVLGVVGLESFSIAAFDDGMCLAVVSRQPFFAVTCIVINYHGHDNRDSCIMGVSLFATPQIGRAHV